MESFQMRMNDDDDLQEADENRSLWDLVNDLNRGVLNVPSHQRKFVWKDEQIRGWVNRIRSKRRPVGAVVTYQIMGEQGAHRYINDGSQRIRATEMFLLDSIKYGACDKERAELIARKVRMPVQHRIYETREDALEDFQLLNIGTSLTPLEFCHGILSYMSGYEAIWKPIFERIHRVVATSSIVLAGKDTTSDESDRLGQHKHKRHNYSLFVRFSSGRTDQFDFKKIGTASIDRASVENKTVVEWLLRLLCEGKGIKAIQQDIEAFSRFVERETATVEDIWRNVRREPGLMLSPTVFRWILDCAIWKRNNEISNAVWESFVSALLTHCQGNTTVVAADKPDVSETLGLSQMGKIKKICEIIGSDFYDSKVKPLRKTRTVHRRPGYDISHIEPFSLNGEGDVIIEPASRNRARGAKPIADEDDE